MLEGITERIIKELKDNNLNLSHLWLLEQLIVGNYIDIPEMNALERRFYINDKEITEKGKDYYYSLITENNIEKDIIQKDNTRQEINNLFDLWWGVRGTEGIYPSTDNFEYKGKIFQGVQKKNIKKEDCKSEFNKIIKLGEYTGEEIVEGTRNHIQIAKDDSIKKGKNQLSFIANSERYLRLRAFSPFITKLKTVDNGEFTGTDF